MPREDVIVRFGADVKALQGSMSKIEAGIGGLSRAAAAFGLALGGGAMASLVRETTRWADTLTNTSQRVGVAVEQVQALRAEAEKFGVSTQQTDTALQRFSRRIGEAQQGTGTLLKVFEQYRIQLQDTQGRQRSVNAMLEDFARVLQSIEDPAERNRVAMAAFDTEGVKLGQTLANLNGTIDDTTQALLEQGRIMREESIAAAAAFETKWTEMVQSANNTWRAFVVNVIDGWKTVLQGFSAADITQSISGGDISNQIGQLKNQKAPWYSMAWTADEKARWEQQRQAQIASLQKQREIENKLFVARRQAESALAGLTAPGAISGGRSGGGGRRGAAASQSALNKEMEEGKRLMESLRTPAETYTNSMARLHELLAAGAIGQETFNRAVDKYQETLADANKQTDTANDAARELGMTFSSAFEDAITQGRELSDVLRGLAQDVLRIFVRKSITEPVANFVSGAVGNLLPFADGGVMTGNGPRPLKRYAGGGIARTPQLAMFGEGSGAEAYVPLPDGRRIPVDMRGGGQAVTINQSFDFAGANPATVQLLRQEAAGIVEASKRAVFYAIEQGGAYAGAVGRR